MPDVNCTINQTDIICTVEATMCNVFTIIDSLKIVSNADYGIFETQTI